MLVVTEIFVLATVLGYNSELLAIVYDPKNEPPGIPPPEGVTPPAQVPPLDTHTPRHSPKPTPTPRQQ